MRTSAVLVLVGLAAGSAYGQSTFLGQNAFPKSPAPAPPRFEFKDLPSGRYTITASRPGYIRLQYGQRRTGEPGRPVQLGEGQRLENLDFSLVKNVDFREAKFVQVRWEVFNAMNHADFGLPGRAGTGRRGSGWRPAAPRSRRG